MNTWSHASDRRDFLPAPTKTLRFGLSQPRKNSTIARIRLSILLALSSAALMCTSCAVNPHTKKVCITFPTVICP